MPTGDVTRLYQVKSQLDQDNTIVQQYDYDSQGRLSSKTLSYMKMPPLVLSFDYDTLDRIKQEIYPAEYGFQGGNPRQKIDYEYQAGDVLKQLQVDQVGYASEMKYGPGGQLTSVRVGASAGNPSTETYGYDPANGLPSEQSVHQKGKKLLNLGYKYFPGGQLKQLLDLDPSKDLNSRAYSYDALARLRSVSGPLPNGDAWKESYTFDEYGNRTAVELSPPTAPIPLDGFPSHSYDQNTNRVSGFTYDAAGNVTRAQRMESTGKTFYWVRYRYDDAGRLALVAQDGDKPKLIEAYAYGSDRHRLMRRDFRAPESTLYVWDGDLVAAEYNPNFDSDSLLWLKSTIYLGNRVLATFQPSKASYHHPDRLGTRLITNNIDSTSIEQLTLPFGTLIGESADPVNPIFTTYDRSSATGLDYAVNRHYDSQDRFTQVDPAEMHAADSGHPQSLNLYSYAGNDPVNGRDPLGLLNTETCTDNGDGTFDCETDAGNGGTETITLTSEDVNIMKAEEAVGEHEITVIGIPPAQPPAPAMSSSFQDFMMSMLYNPAPGSGSGVTGAGQSAGQASDERAVDKRQNEILKQMLPCARLDTAVRTASRTNTYAGFNLGQAQNNLIAAQFSNEAAHANTMATALSPGNPFGLVWSSKASAYSMLSGEYWIKSAQLGMIVAQQQYTDSQTNLAQAQAASSECYSNIQ
jgi:RHS repeat-associated protein